MSGKSAYYMKLELQPGSRSRILAALILIVMAVFVVRLFQLQIIDHDKYVAMADSEQIKSFTLKAKRGLIYTLDDNTPTPLVLNESVYTVFADPSTIDPQDRQTVASTVKQIAGDKTRDNLVGLLETPNSRYQILATKLTRDQAGKIKAADMSGVGVQEGTQRVYPEGQLASQTLGFVNGEGEGQYGVEQALNDRLSGQDGLLKTVTDVNQVPLTIGDKNISKPAKDGENIVLTIDRTIQAHVEQALQKGLDAAHAPHGNVIVMDPNNGHILAMASMPTYNPSEYNKVTDPSVFNAKAVTEPYEPGSDIKTLTVATGIDKGVITPQSTYVNTDYIKVDDRTITNATKGQTGTITIQHALDYSLNTGMVTIAERLGDGSNINLQARSTMYDYFHNHFGFGQLTGVEVAGEAPGIVIPPSDPEGNAVRYSNMAFGQGMDLTMVQVSAAFSSIINGGTYYQPTVVAGTMNGDTFDPTIPNIAREHTVSASTSSTVRDMIAQARRAFYSGSDKPGYTIGGKTGTSQTIINGRYGGNATIGTYLGYGGTDTPKYVIMVEVSGDGMNLEGGKHANPIFTDISNWLLDYMKLQPQG